MKPKPVGTMIVSTLITIGCGGGDNNDLPASPFGVTVKGRHLAQMLQRSTRNQDGSAALLPDVNNPDGIDRSLKVEAHQVYENGVYYYLTRPADSAKMPMYRDVMGTVGIDFSDDNTATTLTDTAGISHALAAENYKRSGAAFIAPTAKFIGNDSVVPPGLINSWSSLDAPNDEQRFVKMTLAVAGDRITKCLEIATPGLARTYCSVWQLSEGTETVVFKGHRVTDGSTQPPTVHHLVEE